MLHGVGCLSGHRNSSRFVFPGVDVACYRFSQKRPDFVARADATIASVSAMLPLVKAVFVLQLAAGFVKVRCTACRSPEPDLGKRPPYRRGWRHQGALSVLSFEEDTRIRGGISYLAPHLKRARMLSDVD